MSTDERLQALEKSVRLWRRLVIVFGLVTVLGVAGRWGLDGGGPKTALAKGAKDQYIDRLTVNYLSIVNKKRQRVASFGGVENFAFLELDDLSDDRNKISLSSGLDANVTIKSQKVSLSLGNDGLILARRDLDKERRAIKFIEELKGELNQDDRENLLLAQKDLIPVPVLRLGIGEAQGGIMNISNPLGKKVISLQSNQNNEGALYLNDVNGELKKAF